MTDTPSTVLLTREQSTGSNVNLWGPNLITTQRQTEQAMKGIQSYAVTGDATIPWTNYATGNIGQCAVLKLTGTPSAASTLTFPGYHNWMIVPNSTGKAITIKCAGGTGVPIPTGTTAYIYSDGVDYYAAGPTTLTSYVSTLTNNGDIVVKATMEAAIAAAIAAASIAVSGQVLANPTDTTPGYLGTKLTTQFSTATTTQVSGLLSLQWATVNVGGNEQKALLSAPGYVSGYLPGGTKSAQFTPVVGTEYNCDLTGSSWTINLSGMTAPQVSQRIKLNCFGNFQPFLLGTVNGLTNLLLDAGTSTELTYSSASWGWN